MGKMYPKIKINRKSRSHLVFFSIEIFFNSNDTHKNFVDEITVANHVGFVQFYITSELPTTTGQPREEMIIFFYLLRQLRLNKSTIVCHGNE